QKIVGLVFIHIAYVLRPGQEDWIPLIRLPSISTRFRAIQRDRQSFPHASRRLGWLAFLHRGSRQKLFCDFDLPRSLIAHRLSTRFFAALSSCSAASVLAACPFW